MTLSTLAWMILLAEEAHVPTIAPGSGPLTYKTHLITDKPAEELGNVILTWIKASNRILTSQPVPSINRIFVVMDVSLGINSARNCRMASSITPLPLYVAFVVTGMPLFSPHNQMAHISLLL